MHTRDGVTELECLGGPLDGDRVDVEHGVLAITVRFAAGGKASDTRHVYVRRATDLGMMLVWNGQYVPASPEPA